MFHPWRRGMSWYFILRPKGLLDNFFVRQVGMLKQEAGPKATWLVCYLLLPWGSSWNNSFSTFQGQRCHHGNLGNRGRKRVDTSIYHNENGKKKYSTIFRWFKIWFVFIPGPNLRLCAPGVSFVTQALFARPDLVMHCTAWGAFQQETAVIILLYILNMWLAGYLRA